MTEPHDDLLARLRAADPVDPTGLPTSDSAPAQELLARVTAGDEDASGGSPIRFVTPPRVNRRPSRISVGRRSQGLMAAAAAVVLLVAGVVVFSPGGTAPALATVQNAAADTASVGSGRVTTTFSLEENSDSESSGSGTVSAVFAGQDVAVTAEALESSEPGMGELAEGLEARLVDGTVYINDGQRWMSLEGGNLIGSTVADYLDPRSVLDTVNDLTEVDEVGPATVDGVDVTHYTGVIDLGGESVARLLGRVDPTSTEVRAEGEATIELYVDGDGLLRRLELSGQAREPEGDESLDFTIATVFSDLGADLTVDAPADAVAFSADGALIPDGD